VEAETLVILVADKFRDAPAKWRAFLFSCQRPTSKSGRMQITLNGSSSAKHRVEAGNRSVWLKSVLIGAAQTQ
jgi:hypothetical protein